ncbi:hypothetical protein OZX56_05930 [Lactobacillus sp. ESL0684]|uniref:hypothetical protein n=1 Tax=Lactobacillus sp. ESL0684 TaxID=2983213 RepID=UPI0023F7C8D1|nr:hypothetical protein [Lactobacillus sp. ESL0684]WEV43085.1 hypothetical protein OZX56_05930 [Lactobacillus sp. ESL0684]
MAYFTLELKKVIKNTLTFIGIGIILVILFDVLYQNSKVTAQYSSIGNTYENIAMAKKNKQKAQADMKKYPRNSRKYNLAKEEYSYETDEIKDNRAIIKDINANNWSQAYTLLKKQNQKLLNHDSEQDPELKQAIKKEILRFDTLKKANLPEESDEYPVTGLLFILNCLDNLLPILLTLVLIFILTNLYSERYSDKLDKVSLLPSKNIQFTELVSGFAIGILILSLVLIVVFGVSSVIFGPGTLKYPTLGVNIKTNTAEYLPLFDRLVPTLILQILVLPFLAAFILLVVNIFKSRVNSLLIGSLIILGGAFLPTIIVPFQKIAQFFPTTYIFSLHVVNGNLASITRNSQITFSMGIFILIIWTVILILINLLETKLSSKLKRK